VSRALASLLDGWLKTTMVHRHAFVPSLTKTREIGREGRVPASFAEAVRPILQAFGGPSGSALERAAEAGRWSEAARLTASPSGAPARVLGGLLRMHGRSSRGGFDGMLDRCAHRDGARRLEAACRDGKFWPAFAWLGLARLRRSDLGGARQAFGRLAELRPEWPWSWLLRSECARVDIELDESLADLDRAIELEPGNPWAWALRSRVRFQKAPGPKGLEELDEAIRLDPGSGWLRAWRGDARRKLGDLKGALADLVAARTLEPGYDRTYLWLGKTLSSLGDHRRALEALDEGPKRCPHFEKAFAERSRALRRAGRWSESVLELERAARINHRHNWLGCWTAEPAPLDAERRRELSAVEEAARRLPRSARILAWRGESRMQSGDAVSGLSDLDAALRRSPGLAWARAWRGEALVRLGRLKEARRELDAAARLDPSYGRTFAWRGRLRHLCGDSAGAIADLNRSVGDSFVEYSWLYFWRAEAERAMGREQRAAEDVRTALYLEPRRTEFQSFAGRLGP
jgi:tetratricopeptide (TPR) repeat protein